MDAMSLERMQTVCWWIAGVGAALALAASLGARVLPVLGPGWVVPAHLFLLAVGAGFGWMAHTRQGEIEAKRWEILADDGLTQGERTYAHKDAESAMTKTLAAFLVAPLFVAGWLTYQIQDPESPLATDVLALSAFAGYALGLGTASWLRRPRED